MLRLLLFLTLLATAIPLPSAQAIIVAAGNGRLLLPPTGAYANSGNQYIGKWGNFSGTAIGSHHFITAVHVGGGVGDAFVLGNQRFTAEAQYIIPGTDLAVWRVAERFPQFATIYTGDQEVGMEAILFGCGFQRGNPLQIDGQIRGWLWGNAVSTLSWGWNRVAGIISMAGNGEVLIFPFTPNKAGNVAGVANGDSGGGVFVHDGANWKMAGVLYATSGRYSHTANGKDLFMATLTDARGLYQNLGDHWEWLDPENPLPAPTLSFATRISPHADEIQAIIAGKRENLARHPLSHVRLKQIAVAIAVLIGIALTLVWFRTWRKRKQQTPSAASNDP